MASLKQDEKNQGKQGGKLLSAFLILTLRGVGHCGDTAIHVATTKLGKNAKY